MYANSFGCLCFQGYGVIPGDTVDINRRDVLVTGLAGTVM